MRPRELILITKFLISNLRLPISGLKQNIEDGGKNPQQNKSRRIITSNMSTALVAFGLVIVGASLLSDMLGTYHAHADLLSPYLGSSGLMLR